MKIERNTAEEIIRTKAPFVFSATMTQDMGVDFSAVVPAGIIYNEPGVLLEYADRNGRYFGAWPPSKWSVKDEEDFSRCMREFLINDFWSVMPWEEVDDELVFYLVRFLKESDFVNLNSYQFK